MKKALIFLAMIAIGFSSAIGQSVPSQKKLFKDELSFRFVDDLIYHQFSGKCKATRQFYSDDEGQTVYHGDVVITSSELDPSIYRPDYGKPALTINGRLHYNEGKLDGPFSVNYSYKNLGHKTNMYGLCSGSYSIKGAFDNGYATGVWTVSCQTTSVTKKTSTDKYTLTVKYDKGKIVSYTKTTNGETVTLDARGNVCGVIGKHNIRHGLELPKNDVVGDELSALMERGQIDSAIWKGIDNHYHFSTKYGDLTLGDDGRLKYDWKVFKYDILSITVNDLFEKLGGIVEPQSQFGGESKILLQNKEAGSYCYKTYNDFLEVGFNREKKNEVYKLYNAVHVSHLYHYCFMTSTVASRLQPLADSLMKEVTVDILASNITKLIKGLHDKSYLRENGGLTLSDTIINRVGVYEQISASNDDILVIDSADTVMVLVPCAIVKRSLINPSIPVNYVMGVGVIFDAKQRLDKVGWNGWREPENVTFFTTELLKVPSLWDTVAIMLDEWDALMREANKYNNHTIDFEHVFKMKSDGEKLETLNTARENYNFLNSILPKARALVKAMPIDQEACFITKELLQMDNVLPAMKERISSSNVYAGVIGESEMVEKAKYLKQYYADMRSFLVLSKQCEANHPKIMSYMKEAKYIVKIYEEYYATVTYEWDVENSKLPTLKSLVEKQNKLLNLLNRSDLEDVVKKAKKSKLKTIDEILTL